MQISPLAIALVAMDYVREVAKKHPVNSNNTILKMLDDDTYRLNISSLSFDSQDFRPNRDGFITLGVKVGLGVNEAVSGVVMVDRPTFDSFRLMLKNYIRDNAAGFVFQGKEELNPALWYQRPTAHDELGYTYHQNRFAHSAPGNRLWEFVAK